MPILLDDPGLMPFADPVSGSQVVDVMARAVGAERAPTGLGATRQELSRKRNTSELNQASRRVMSHSDALSRLTGGDRRSDMIKRLLRRAAYKFERDRTYDASYIRDRIDESACRIGCFHESPAWWGRSIFSNTAFGRWATVKIYE